MITFEQLLSGGDLRSIGEGASIIALIHTQCDFDRLFRLLYHADRLIVMRAADAVEKITVDSHQFLSGHEAEILAFCRTVINKELQWHLAQLLPRLKLNREQSAEAMTILRIWATDKRNSRIVRVEALQSVFDMTDNKSDVLPLFAKLEKEAIPSLTARIKRLKKQTGRSF